MGGGEKGWGSRKRHQPGAPAGAPLQVVQRKAGQEETGRRSSLVVNGEWKLPMVNPRGTEPHHKT